MQFSNFTNIHAYNFWCNFRTLTRIRVLVKRLALRNNSSMIILYVYIYISLLLYNSSDFGMILVLTHWLSFMLKVYHSIRDRCGIPELAKKLNEVTYSHLLTFPITCLICFRYPILSNVFFLPFSDS